MKAGTTGYFYVEHSFRLPGRPKEMFRAWIGEVRKRSGVPMVRSAHETALNELNEAHPDAEDVEFFMSRKISEERYRALTANPDPDWWTRTRQTMEHA